MKIGDEVKIINEDDIWSGSTGKVVEIDDNGIAVKIKFETEDGDTKSIIQLYSEEDLEEVEKEDLNMKMDLVETNLKENKKSVRRRKIMESNQTKKDFIKDYVYIEDIDGRKIPSWNFVAKIATAENVDDCVVFEVAEKYHYNLFVVEAYNFYREIVAAKEIKEEDIAEDYGDYLQGKVLIYAID